MFAHNVRAAVKSTDAAFVALSTHRAISWDLHKLFAVGVGFAHEYVYFCPVDGFTAVNSILAIVELDLPTRTVV